MTTLNGNTLTVRQITWDASQRTGSRGIIVWESTNLVDWTAERLVTVEDENAGMVWAPEAIWDPNEGMFQHRALPLKGTVELTLFVLDR